MWKLLSFNAICIAIASSLVLNCTTPGKAPASEGVTEDSTFISVDTQKVDDLVRLEMERQKIPGVAMAIAQKGKIIYKRNFGLANIEHSVNVKNESPFKVASLTKPITAIAIMQLVEEGKISLDDKIESYIDSIPGPWTSITINQLLTHTSGLADYFQAPDWSWRNSWRLDLSHREFLQMCSRSPMVCQPGERMQYCNTGYYLLGMIIEKVSGMSYSEYLSQRIFEPIGMLHSQLDRSRLVVPDRVSGYTLDHGKLQNSEYTSDTWAYSEGGVITTAEDLAKLDSSFYSEALLKKSTIEQLWAPAKLSNGSYGIIGDNGAGKPNYYGLGWFISDYKDHKFILAGGNKPGYTCIYFRFPDNQISIIVLSNLSSCQLYPLAGKIGELFYGD